MNTNEYLYLTIQSKDEKDRKFKELKKEYDKIKNKKCDNK
jgi:hypothetical protein